MSERHLRGVLVAVAAGAGFLAFLGLAFPQAARPFVSVLVGVGLLAVVVVAVATLRARTEQPESSPFDRRRRRTADDLPSDLLGLTLDARRMHPRRPITSVVFWRIRRLADHRLRHRHGVDLGNSDQHARLRQLVSPTLFLLLTDDRARIPGESLPRLITELEQL